MSLRGLFLIALALLGAAGGASAAPTIALQSGQAVNIPMPAGSFTTSYFIDVGANDQLLTLDLTTPANNDSILGLRFGTPYVDQINGRGAEANYLLELSHYKSLSFSGSDSIAIGRYNNIPLRQGRWFVVVVNAEATQINATLRATLSQTPATGVPIEVVFTDGATDGSGTNADPCDLNGWTDATARAPAGGNSGATLGEQRRNAVLEAARLLSAELRSPVPVRIKACWGDLGTGNSVTLARAGPRFVFRNVRALATTTGGLNFVEPDEFNPGLTRPQTWFSSAPAAKQMGVRLCGSIGQDPSTGSCNTRYDLRATFNIQVDTPNALGDRSFYYGFSPQPAGGVRDTDFVSVAMHEIAHGLGFLGLVNRTTNPIGGKFNGYDDAYIANIVRVQGDGMATPFTVTRFIEGSDADRVAAMTSVTGLRWDDARATNHPGNVFSALAAPDNLVRLFAPDPIQGGSTLSHIVNATEPNALMLPQASGTQRALGLAFPMLEAVGWSTQTVVPAPKLLSPTTQFFDPRKPGHGIDISLLGTDADGRDLYLVIFYTYGSAGEPEWYLAQGFFLDGVFMPANNSLGDSLSRFRFVQGGGPQAVDSDAQIRIDFNSPQFAPACTGVAGAANGALMTWTIGTDRNQNWCMVPLVPLAPAPNPNFTGTWFGGGAEGAWGASIVSFRSGANNAQFGLVYYPDSQNNGRWAYYFTDNFQSGMQMNLLERRGYGRTAPVPADALAGRFTDVPAGNVTLNLSAPSQNPATGNRIRFNATYQTAPGGSFTRDVTTFALLSRPVQ
jgi:hypothetical protein